MSIALMTLAWQTALPLNKKTALLAIADWANDDGASIHPSMWAVAERLTCSERTAQRLLKELEGEKWIAVIANAFGGRPGTTKHYRLNVRKLRAHAAAEEARRSAIRIARASRRIDSHEAPDPFSTGDNLSETGDKLSGFPTGDNLSGVTNQVERGDKPSRGGVTNQVETGDTGVTLSTIEPPLEPPMNHSGPAFAAPPVVIDGATLATPAAKALKTKSAAADPKSPAAPAAPVDVVESALQAACRATWTAYSDAYCVRYGSKPVRNASVNARIKQFVQRLGHDESPAVAEFFVNCVSDSFVVRKVHDVGLLLSGAEGYRTQWVAGSAMTGTRAKQIDQSQANFDTADEAMSILRARRAQQQGAQPC